MAVVQQKSVLFKGTIRSNLLWGKEDATEEELWEALRIAQAEEVVRGKDGQLDELVEQDGRNFSGGQKQRTAVARALITQPELILADEPTGALDSKASDSMLTLFNQINEEGQTILMVTHSTKAASHANRVLFIKDGEVFHQLYRGNMSNEQLYAKISDTLTVLTTGGEQHE